MQSQTDQTKLIRIVQNNFIKAIFISWAIPQKMSGCLYIFVATFDETDKKHIMNFSLRKLNLGSEKKTTYLWAFSTFFFYEDNYTNQTGD